MNDSLKESNDLFLSGSAGLQEANKRQTKRIGAKCFMLAMLILPVATELKGGVYLWIGDKMMANSSLKYTVFSQSQQASTSVRRPWPFATGGI